MTRAGPPHANLSLSEKNSVLPNCLKTAAALGLTVPVTLQANSGAVCCGAYVSSWHNATDTSALDLWSLLAVLRT
jgi:hypothetical protein